MSSQTNIYEKIRQLNGKDEWRTYGELIAEIVFSDGPTGLRYQEGKGDHLGMTDSKKATCFPTASALASTWNRELVKQVSAAIAKEAICEGVDVLLGPGVNIKRNPLCGRNFEYFSEDPYLASQLGSEYIKGLQENGVGSSLKHFAGNNQEAYRMSIDTIIDRRAQEEIYLKVFKDVIDGSNPWTVMSAYNRLMGSHCCENHWLLTETLREKWGYEGLVISDWFAVNDIVKSIANGMDLEMPTVGDYSYNKLKDAYEQGDISEDAINRAFNNLNTLRERCDNPIKKAVEPVNYMEHHELARDVATEAIVLLKNENQRLPLQSTDKVLYVGSLMEKHNYQGSGSSRVNPMFMDSISDFLVEGIKYLPGYSLNNHEVNQKMINDVLDEAREMDKIVVFTGLFSNDEAESYDRENLDLPLCQRHLIESLILLNKPIILVLQTGSVVEIPWVNQIDGILQANLSGQGTGKAIADILLGKKNPCGRLNETYPIKLAHSPSYLHRGSEKRVEYNESIFVGYRYYDKKELEVLFPFGYGLSYTEFQYSDFDIEKDEESISVTCKIENTGNYDGAEVVQIYIGLNVQQAIQPVKQLKYFDKVTIKKNETYHFQCKLPLSDFRYFNSDIDEWAYATGENTIYIGQSSRNIVYQQRVDIDAFDYKYPVVTRNTTVGALLQIPVLLDIINYTMNELSSQLMVNEEDIINHRELENSIKYMPLRNISQATKGFVSDEQLDQLIYELNVQLKHRGC
ncbi:beta-glucosidase [Vallitalea okinawensis]|uniref:beta-glucosidase n=1 Tax=Vallitalea okinawensis TaxID=2078660 RepID=UPI001479332C|nr:glycoside hydrolase family 3 C-terminal domain-containing protein [Vallitalea okinawensis]